ncbi:MAG: alkane 1-monooxygenase [Sphingobacteriales bacterium]|nr:alkane 1-monooxygenase [Sphingobacteriales bacterium]MBI3720378.1 alkane 1-monooxygenase [Sphingobacteriales bacterium]
MNIRAFKYASPLIVFGMAYFAFTLKGWWVALPLLYAWIFIPLVELFIKPNNENVSKTEEELIKNDPLYDWWLYIIVVLQYVALFYFLQSMKDTTLSSYEIAGRTLSMGLLCGVFGINVAHELGHRVKTSEQLMAKALLLTSLYMHFFTEHNKGHHKRVATREDPSSARYNEPIYIFYFRTVIFSYISAWHIANDEMKKMGLSIFNWKNEMIQFHLIEIIFVGLIFYLYGWMMTIYFIAAAIIGFLLLETVNYIEHYGLQRKPTGEGKYERAMPEHSWNSDHTLGRLMLYELSRHSDHHYLASRKYQILRHHNDAPQMPTGYPGMMILSLMPPVWFRIMNKRIKEWNKIKSPS